MLLIIIFGILGLGILSAIIRGIIGTTKTIGKNLEVSKEIKDRQTMITELKKINSGSSDKVSQLQNCKKLLDEGTISTEEYEKLKKQILE